MKNKFFYTLPPNKSFLQETTSDYLPALQYFLLQPEETGGKEKTNWSEQPSRL
jgi:hypothetical protein